LTKGPAKIGVAGTHSTGKSTLISAIQTRLAARGLKIGRIDDLAQRARDLGFPILTKHTYESTLWIMAECMRQEAEASLNSDVILVDRPVFDALGYLEAALEVTHRQIEQSRIEELRAIAAAHAQDYDLLVVTVLDSALPLGEGRDSNLEFRQAAGRHIDKIARQIAPTALRLTAANSEQIAGEVIEFVLAKGMA